MTNYQCLSIIKYQSKSFVGKLTITDHSLVFTSLSVTISIKFDDITTYTKSLRGIVVDQFLFKVILKDKVFKELLSRVISFRTVLKPRNYSSTTLASRPSLAISRDRSSTNSSSRYTPELRTSTSFGLERYTWITVEKNQVNMDLQEFFYEIQANPPTITMPSDSSNSTLLVVTKKSKWIPYTELIQARKITKDINYHVQHVKDLRNEEVVSKLMVKSTYDSRLIFYVSYEIPTLPNEPKLKVYIKLRARQLSERVLKFKIEYDVEFGDLKIDQLITKLSIQQQIKNHFGQIFLIPDTDLGDVPERAPSSKSVTTVSGVAPTYMFWIPQIKRIEVHQGLLLIIWLMIVGSLISSIIIQKDLKRR